MRELVVAAFAILSLSSSCAPRRPTLRYGGLEADARPFRFEHGIEVFAVKNGMKVALLRDTRTNLVTVDVRYTVGAAEDPKGAAGMAHLAEHLMFELRSEPSVATLGDRLSEVALFYNAYTNHDETHYTSTALAAQLDAVLEIEARRLEFTCAQLDEALFLRERDVVLEEEAQRAGPYDGVWAEVTRAVWGGTHPYARQVGSREIADVTREQACEFISQHYAPDRAILVVTGNFDLEQTTAKISKRFGPLTGHSTGRRVAIVEPDLDGRVSEHVADVDEASAVVFFPSPAWGGDDFAPYEIVRTFLAFELGEASEDLDWVTDVTVARAGGNRAPAMAVQVSVSDPDRLDDAIALVGKKADELRDRTEWRRLERIRGPIRAQYMTSWDRFLSRGGWIADFLQYTDHNWFFLAEMAAFDRLDAREVRRWAKTNLSRKRSHVAKILPSGKEARDTRVSIASAGKEHDLTPWRSPVDPDEAARAVTTETRRVATEVVDERLANGLRVVLAPDPDSPLVVAQLLFPVGTASDPPDRRGVATAAAELLEHDTDAGYKTKDWLILDWVLGLGTDLGASVDETTTTFAARGLAMHADWHVWRLFWLLDLGRYDPEALRALQRAAAADDDDEDDRDVRDEALRERLFGADHPYSAPRMSDADLKKLRTGELDKFRDTHYRAHGATLIVTGGFDVAAMREEIAALFGAWGEEPAPAPPAVPAIAPVEGPSYVGVRDPEVSQPRLTIAFATSSDPERDRAARMILTEMIEDRARVVREGMGATYGVSIAYSSGAGGAVLRLDAALDPARAGKAMAALLAELAALRDGAKQLAEDFVRARRRALANSLADSAGASDLAGELAAVVHEGLPLDYFSQLSREIGETTLDDVAALAAQDLAERRMVVVLSGRKPVIEGALAAAGVTAEMLDED